MKKERQLSQGAIDSFKAIYNEDFGKQISDDAAEDMGLRLLRLIDLLLEPDTGGACE